MTQRFGDVQAAHGVGAFEVGQGAGDAQDAVIGAGRQFHGIDCFQQGRCASGVGRRDRHQQFAVGLGIGADWLASAGALVARGLHGTGAGDAGRNFGRTLGGRREREIAGGHSGHVDM